MENDTDKEERYRKLLNEQNTSRALYANQFDKEWMDRRMVSAQANRVLQQIKVEEETEKYNEYKISHDALYDAKVAREEALVKELELMKREKRIEESKRQQIRENNPELRELEKKLRAAYVNRDVMQQIRENEYRNIQNLIERDHDRKIILAATYNEREYERMLEEVEIRKKATYGKDLREQLVNAARQKECAYEDNIIEREKINEIVRTMHDEDVRETELKKLNKEKVRREMETFQMAKNAWKEKQRLLILQEEEKLEDIEKEKILKHVDQQKQYRQKFEKTQVRTRHIANQISNEKAQKDERENLVISLYEQELLDIKIQREKNEQLLLEQKKEETRIALLKQMDERRVKDMQAKQEDLRFRMESQQNEKNLMRKDMDREKQRREKNLAYGIDIKRQMALNKEKEDREREEDSQRNANVKKHREQIIKDVMAERKSMIKEFAPKALGFLQQGLLTNEDLPLVREGCANDPAFKDVNIEAMFNKNPNPSNSKCNSQCARIQEY